MSDQAILSSRWQKLARLTAWKVNLGWWSEFAAPGWVGMGALSFVGIFWARSQAVSLSWPLLASGLIMASVLVLLVSWLWARRYFMSLDAALVWLEARLHLHNALTTARLGLGPWPELAEVVGDGLRWRWSRLGGPWSVFVVCLLSAFYLPVTQDRQAVLPDAEPQAWTQMQEWLEKLKEEKVTPPEVLTDQESKLEALRQQPQDKWFSHESLNAGDTLKEQLQREIASLGRRLSDAERSLNTLQNYGDKLSQETQGRLQKEFAESLEAMKAGSLPLDPDLLEKLSQLDPENLRSMSQEQLDQLRDALKDKSRVCQAMGEGLGQEKGFLCDGVGEDELAAHPQDPMPAGPELGEGSGRGPGAAPLTLSQEESRFDTARKEGVKSQDFSRAQLGTVLEVQKGRHEVDKAVQAPVAAGAVASPGQGGGQVWRESLTPEEKAVLKRVFQ